MGRSTPQRAVQCAIVRMIREPVCSKGKNAMTDEQSTSQKKVDEWSAQRATAARVLEWLESDHSFLDVYGLDSRNRHAARERERIDRLDNKIAVHKRSLVGELIDPTELRALQQQVASAIAPAE